MVLEDSVPQNKISMGRSGSSGSSNSSSSGSAPASFFGGNHHEEGEGEDIEEHISDLHRIVTNSTSGNQSGDNVLARLETMSRTISHMSHEQMKSFQIDANDFDLGKVLKFISSRNESQGIGEKKTDVTFTDLTVIGKNASAAVAKDAGSVFFPFVDKLKAKLNHKPEFDFSKLPKTRKIIKDVNGFAIPGTMTLVLGRPGAGCSTFLKTIAGQTQTYLGVEGEISYDGIPRKEMNKNFPQQLIYVPELDVHFPYLTVQQTLEFAIGCKAPSVRIDNISRKKYVETMKDLYTVLFGLNHVEKTLVGNDFVRGISGGQRKRVSIAEAMATRGTVFCYDNATRGLDASTALEFAEALRTSTNITDITCFVTAYQASESIYKLFDYVTVLYLGRQVYFGKANEAVDYFVRLGFEKPPRQTSGEFLTAITDPQERKARPGFERQVPNDPDSFEECWKQSPEFAKLQEDIAKLQKETSSKEASDRFKQVQLKEKQKLSSSHTKYTVNYFQQLRLCCLRALQNIANNKAYTIIEITVAVFQALIVGSLYYNTPSATVGAFSRGGAIFFAILYFVIMSLAEVSTLFENKPILDKQRGYWLYHPSAQVISKQLVQAPLQFITILLFSLILYFLTDLKREAGSYFIFLLFINISMQTVSSIFTFISSLCPTLSVANAITGILMMMLLLYSSFMVQRPSMYWWFKWFSYINPVLYGFESMITSEFHGRNMPCSPNQLIPSGAGYTSISSNNSVCGFVGSALSRQQNPSIGDGVNGDIYMKLAFDYSYSHTWRNLGILFGFLFGILALNVILVEVYNPVVTAADKLTFIKTGTIPEEFTKSVSAKKEKDDLESGGSDETNPTVVSHSEVDNDIAMGELGSKEIFMWKHINYTVPYAGTMRKLLDDIQGYVQPGALTALMGESGAGKTTLLNVLSQRVDVGVVTGDFMINGRPLDPSFERKTGYVQQQDVHIAELTVKESLEFAARLRRSNSVSDSEKIEYVDKIMKILHMEEYKDAVVGEAGFGLNVEQRKKLSIATELVAKPSLLLFLDEPTSGLDSQSAWAIVQVLKKLAKAGQAILCTIHQPSASLFEQFDRLLLMKVGGQTVYFGDIGKNSSTVIHYFESHGGRKCLPDENSAEYILEVIGAGATAKVDQDWFKVWCSSKEYQDLSQKIDELIETTSKIPVSDSKELQGKFAAPYYTQFIQVLKRTSTQFYRDLDYVMSKFMLMVLGGLIHGFSFWKVKHTSIGMQNAMFANFMAIIMAAPLLNGIQARAIKSRELFEVRESKSNTFHWSTLLISQFLVEIPYSVIFSTFYYIAWYFPIQLPLKASIAGLWWLTYCVFFQLYYISFGLAVIYFAPDLPSANVIIGMLLNFVISFCGVVQVPALMPGFWKFMWRLSPFTYFVDNMLSTSIHDRAVRCDSNEMNYLNPPDGMSCGQYLNGFFKSHNGYVANPESTSNCAVCQYSVGDEYLKTVGMSFSHRWRNIGFFCVYILFNVVCMLGLYYLFRVRGVGLPKLQMPKFLQKKPEKKIEQSENTEKPKINNQDN